MVIQELRQEYKLDMLLEIAQLPRSTYYYHSKRQSKEDKYLEKCECDPSYPIVPSYTYNSDNLDTLIGMTNEKYRKQMIAYDNLDPAIACHWGPNAFGYIFVAGNDNR